MEIAIPLLNNKKSVKSSISMYTFKLMSIVFFCITTVFNLGRDRLRIRRLRPSVAARSGNSASRLRLAAVSHSRLYPGCTILPSHCTGSVATHLTTDKVKIVIVA